MAEMKLEVAFVTIASEAIKSLPTLAILHRRMHRTISGAAGAFGGEPGGQGLRPLASVANVRATESPNLGRKEHFPACGKYRAAG